MDDLLGMLTTALQRYPNIRIFGALIAATCLGSYLYKIYNKRRHEIIVFTRYPIAGKTKTRMIPSLGQTGAANLQRHMTEHLLGNIRKFAAVRKDMDVTVQFNGGSKQQMKYWLDRRTENLNVTYQPQSGGDLGQKMTQAVKNSFATGHDYAIIVGSDIPGINCSLIKEAYDELQSDCDMVLGRAEDGGYYLVGFNKQALSYIDEIFKGMTWGTDQVFIEQKTQAEICGAKLKVLKTFLQDVDTYEDLPVFEKETGLKCQALTPDRWSIIIPVMNEESNIVKSLENIIQCCSDRRRIVEIVVSDGGSTDQTVQTVSQIAETSPVPVRLIHSPPGRGNQQITGVDHSTGDYLLFVHADTLLPQGFDQMAVQCLNTPGNVAGAFNFQFDVLQYPNMKDKESWWFKLQLSVISWGARIRAKKRELPYGDQGLFMSRHTYMAVDGFPPSFLMEDLILVEKLWTLGHVSIADGKPAVTSARRWKKYGCIRVTGFSQIILLSYRLGVHPNTLARWYYGDRLKIKAP